MDKNTDTTLQEIGEFKYKTTPWEHQVKALEYLYPRDVAALYTDMGTGKTKMMIDLIVNRAFKFVLIACTNKGCDVWEAQFKIHSNIGSQNVLNLAGVSSKQKVPLLSKLVSEARLGAVKGTCVVIVNYEGIWREPFARYLMRKTVKLDCVICDESHRIKSPGSKCSRFLARLGKKTPARYLVTGTPLAENPVDTYAQYRFLDPSIFGTSLSAFKERYENVDLRRSMAVGYTILDKKQPYKNLDDLHAKMFSVAFKIPSTVKLPGRKNFTRVFRLSKKATKAYETLERDGVLIFDKGEMIVENALSMVLRKRQVTSGFIPVIDEEKERHTVRLDRTREEELADLLESLPHDEPVVVFATFRPDLKAIRRVCKKLGRGYSELSGAEDTEKEWQKGKTSVIGVQFTSGSESVDLTRARYCVYYTMTDRLSLYLQSKKRIHRPGQTRPVRYYHLVAQLANGKKSVDSAVVEAVRKKKEIVDYVMEKEGIQ